MASGQPPFFYHILMNPSSPHLPLPLKFVKKHLKNRALKKPILKSANGGYLWKLKMKKFDDHTFCFVNGWRKVVKDLGLLFGEFLLFKYVGSSVFLMHVYSVNGCEKILVPRIHNDFKVVDDDEVSVFEEDDDEVEDEVDDEFSVFDDDAVEEDDDDADADVEYDLEEDEDEDNEEDDEVEFGDDDDDDDGEDEDVVDVDGHDGDPFFVITSTKRNKNKLRFPPDLVAMAKIYTKKTITLKNDDGYEKEMPVRSYKQNKLTRHYVAEGWEEFQRSNNVSEGDECVLKFITSEDKLCLAKVTKKKTRAAEVDNDDGDGMDEEGEAEDAKEDDSNVGGDDIFDDDEGEGENSKLVNDDEDDDEDDHDVDGEDGDPSFILTCSEKNLYKLCFSANFVELAGITTKETITLKNLDGYEKELHVRSQRNHQWKSYYLAGGWKEFQQNSKISKGDKFVFKFITSEEKFCVAKITKKRTPARSLPPAAKAPVTEVVDGLDDKDVDDNDLNVDDDKDVVVDENKDEVENVEPVDDGMDGKDVVVNDNKDKDENIEPVDDGMDGKDVVVDENKDEDENVEPVDDGMDGENVVVDDNKGEDENIEPVDDGMDGKDVGVNENKDEDENVKPVADGMDGKDVVVDDNKDEYENVKLVDDGIDGKNVVVDDNKDEDENVEPVDDGMDGKDVVVDENKDEDENVEPVDDGMDGENVVVDDNKGEDENIEPVDDGMDGKDVGVNENKDEDENVKPVADGMDGKDAVVDDNKDEYENVKLVDDGMDGKNVVVDDNKDEDENVEPVDDGMDGKDMVVDDSKDEDENVELVDNGMDVDADDNKDEDKDAEFVVTITPGHKSKLVLPKDFVVLTGIESKKNIIMKSLDGNETTCSIRTDKRWRSISYHLSVGWTAFKRSNNILEGDECVFMYTTSEDKMSLAKISKKITPPTEVDDSDSKVDDGKDVVVGDNKAEDENVELADDGMDVDADDNKDENKDAEFVVTITPIHKSRLMLPKDFVVLAGIESKENIIMKSLDGNETKCSIRTDKRCRSTSYHLSVGWTAVKRSNNISEGDECVFKYFTSEDKMCLAKVTKKKTQTRLPSLAEVVKRKRGRLPPATENKMTPAENVKMRSRRPPPVEITVAESVKRKRGRLPPSSPRVTKDVKRKRWSRK